MAANQMNHNMQFQMMHMMHMTMARQSTALYNPKATYQVVLLDSSEIMVKSKSCLMKRTEATWSRKTRN
ncbi:hypothetical protein [Rufibacter sp. LB8]|uniref:hypothetical protein n=1 Tax=Rufibacter sp. LB8 TaxID=2777781 RepID=UPI00178C17CF|nr:hypothetical protein [Rufibacter sp. LB8]